MPEIATALIQEGADGVRALLSFVSKFSALKNNSKISVTKVVVTLIQAGVDGAAALQAAAEDGNAEMVNVLIQAGVDAHRILIAAEEEGNTKVIDLITKVLASLTQDFSSASANAAVLDNENTYEDDNFNVPMKMETNDSQEEGMHVTNLTSSDDNDDSNNDSANSVTKLSKTKRFLEDDSTNPLKKSRNEDDDSDYAGDGNNSEFTKFGKGSSMQVNHKDKTSEIQFSASSESSYQKAYSLEVVQENLAHFYEIAKEYVPVLAITAIEAISVTSMVEQLESYVLSNPLALLDAKALGDYLNLPLEAIIV